MKIVFVNQPWREFTPGACPDTVGMVHHQLARALCAEHEVSVLARRPVGASTECVWDGVRYELIPTPLAMVTRALNLAARLGMDSASRPWATSPWFYRDYFTRVASAIDRLQPDVVHLSTFFAFLPLIRRVLPEGRLILHMHDHSLALHHPDPLDALEHADAIAGCSRCVAQRIRALSTGLASRVHLLYNGVDTDAFSPPVTAPGGQNLLFVGRRSPEKGLHVLLEAVSRLARVHPGLRVDIVGPDLIAPPAFVDPAGPASALGRYRKYYKPWSSYRRHLRSLVSDEDRARIRWHAFTPHAAMPNWYRQAAALVFPSVWEEPFGLPVAEAMACGVPVVATGGGPSELIENDVSGLLLPAGDAGALAESITRLLSDAALRRRLGQAGCERIRSGFTWQAAAQRALSIYAGFG